MFLTNTENNVEDFLKAMKFIAPEGKNLKYFIVPLNSNSSQLSQAANINGFEPLMPNTHNPNITDDKLIDNTMHVPGVTETITYAKRDNKLCQSVSRNNMDPTEIPPAYPLTKEVTPNPSQNGTNMKTDILISGVQIKPKGAGIKVVESSPNHEDRILNESIWLFPKNTLFHFSKEN